MTAYTLESTAAGSRIAVYRSPARAIPIFVVGGLGGRSAADTPLPDGLDGFASHAGYTIVDLAGAGRSIYRPPLTFETWLADVKEIYARAGASPGLWIGVSIGAWVMLLIHREHPEWFRAMCAMAPAIDWDATYLMPGVATGKFVDEGDAVRIEAGSLPKSLVSSMESHHVLGRPIRIGSPLHCIYGALDDMAPPAAVERLMAHVSGAPSTSVRLAHDGHAMSKLATPASQHALIEWLRGQLQTQAG